MNGLLIKESLINDQNADGWQKGGTIDNAVVTKVLTHHTM